MSNRSRHMALNYSDALRLMFKPGHKLTQTNGRRGPEYFVVPGGPARMRPPEEFSTTVSAAKMTPACSPRHRSPGHCSQAPPLTPEVNVSRSTRVPAG
jgi:hypothetical protein